MTEKRIDYLIADSGAGKSRTYAQKWITSINPSDFLSLTLVDGGRKIWEAPCDTAVRFGR